MKKLYVLFYWLFYTAAYADPFYAEQPPPLENADSPTTAKNTEDLPACIAPENVNEINISTSFSKLTLVGVVQIAGAFRALFIDEENKLFDFKPNDYLQESKIQINEISLKKVIYTDWTKSTQCHKPYQVEQKL